MEDLIRGYGVREGIVGVEGVGVERSVKRQVQSSSTGDVLVKIGNPPPPGSSARKKALAVLQRTSTPSSSSPSSTPPTPPNTYTSGSSNRTKTTTTTYPIPFSALNVNFSSRKVGLVLSTRERKRTIVEVERTREERLEAGAKRLVRELKVWMTGQGQGAW